MAAARLTLPNNNTFGEVGGSWKGIICDTIGYEQHSGECWSDTLQQIFLFADGFKAYTQEHMYTLPYQYWAAIINKNVDFSLRAELSAYIKYMRARFINHYNMMTSGVEPMASARMCPNPVEARKLLKYFDTSVDAPVIHQKAVRLYRQQSQKTALESAQIYAVPGKGLATPAVLNVCNAMFKVFDLPYDVALSPYHCYDPPMDYNIVAILLSVKVRGGTSEQRHMCALLSCNSKTYLYEDNTGMLPTTLPFHEFYNARETGKTVTSIMVDTKTGIPDFIIEPTSSKDTGLPPNGVQWGEGDKYWKVLDGKKTCYKNCFILDIIGTLYIINTKAEKSTTPCEESAPPPIFTEPKTSRPLPGSPAWYAMNGGSRRKIRKTRKNLRRRYIKPINQIK